MSRIFISYRRSDSAYVSDAIYKSLVERFGREHVFKDVDNIPPGVNFKKYLTDKVTECEVLVVVMGSQWLEAADNRGRRLENPTDFVRIELEAALEREVPIIPVFVNDTSMPRPNQLPESIIDLSYHQGLPLRPAPDFDRDMEKLVNAVALHIPELQTQSEPVQPVLPPQPQAVLTLEPTPAPEPIAATPSSTATVFDSPPKGQVLACDSVIWFSHIRGDQELRQHLSSLKSNQELTLRVDGVEGSWFKMRDGRNGTSTPGIRPSKEANEHWKTLLERSRSQHLDIELISIQPASPEHTESKVVVPLPRVVAPSFEGEEVQVWRLTTHWQCPSQAVEIYKQEGYIAAGWGAIGDIRELDPRNDRDILHAIRQAYPKIRNKGSGRRSLWGFYELMKPGDLVILSAEGRRVHVMQVTGDYTYNTEVTPILGDFQHQRPAVSTSIDANELWILSGGFAESWSPRWTLCLCANKVNL